MRNAKREVHRAYWIFAPNAAVRDCIQRIHIPKKILVCEQATHGIEFMLYVEYIGTPDEDNDFLITLDALLAMGARISGMLPPRKTPPDDT